jgi:hypothetical protein
MPMKMGHLYEVIGVGDCVFAGEHNVESSSVFPGGVALDFITLDWKRRVERPKFVNDQYRDVNRKLQWVLAKYRKKGTLIAGVRYRFIWRDYSEVGVFLRYSEDGVPMYQMEDGRVVPGDGDAAEPLGILWKEWGES